MSIGCEASDVFLTLLLRASTIRTTNLRRSRIAPRWDMMIRASKGSPLVQRVVYPLSKVEDNLVHLALRASA